jgi:hypothetical protein
VRAAVIIPRDLETLPNGMDEARGIAKAGPARLGAGGCPGSRQTEGAVPASPDRASAVGVAGRVAASIENQR